VPVVQTFGWGDPEAMFDGDASEGIE